MDDDDDYEALASPSPGAPPKRRTRASVKEKSAQKKVKLPTGQASSSPAPVQDVEDERTASTAGDGDDENVHPQTGIPFPLTPPFEVTAACDNINRFMKCLGAGMTDGDDVWDYRPTSQVRHILALPPSGLHNFRLLVDNVERYTIHHPDGDVEAWRLDARDDKAGHDSQVLELFRILAHGERERLRIKKGKKWVWERAVSYPIPQQNAITTQVCSAREEAIELGNIACDIMNRLPTGVNIATFAAADSNQGPRHYLTPQRIFIDCVALLSWKSDLDLELLPKEFVKPGMTASRDASDGNRGVYGTGMSSDDTTGNSMSTVMSSTVLFFTDAAGTLTKAQQRLKIGVLSTDFRPLAKDEARTPEGFRFRGFYHGNHDDVSRVLQHAYFRCVGLVGTKAQLTTEVKRVLAEFSVPSHEYSGKPLVLDDGRFDASRAFNMSKPYKGGRQTINLTFSAHVAKLLKNVPSDAGFGASGSLLRIHSLHRLHLATIKDEFPKRLQEGKTLTEAIFAVAVKADQVNLGLLPISEINSTYDRCVGNAEADAMEQACCYCSNIFRRDEMLRSDDGLLYCMHRCASLHGAVDTPLEHFTVSGRVRFALSSMRRTVLEKDLDLTKTQEKLEQSIISDNSFQDGYEGHVLEDLYHITGSHDRVSVEKPHAIWVVKNKVHLHHPDNAIITKKVVNQVKGTHLTAMLPWLAELLELQGRIEDEKPAAAYDQDVDTQLRTFERFADNAMCIDKQIPYSSKSRMAMKINEKTFASFIEQLSSGVWQGRVPRSLWLTRRGKGSTEVPADEMWDEATLEDLKGCLRQMEGSGIYNPHSLRFDWNMDGSPKLFRADLRFSNEGWTFYNSEFYFRLLTWRDECNRLHQTSESAATLFLLFALWWLRTGGKCHWFGFRFVYFNRHLQNYSFGRGVYYMDAQGNDTAKAILPGAPMRSGFTTTHPTDMSTDFDFTRLSVIVESWLANVARYTYPVSSYEDIKKSLKQISPSTKWYHPIKSIDEYAANTPRPGCWQDAGKDLTADDEVDDEEEMTYREALDEQMNPTGQDRFEEGDDAEQGSGGGTAGTGQNEPSSGGLTGANPNPTTKAKLFTRPPGVHGIEDAVDDDHLLGNTVINSGSYPNDVFGFPTKDGNFKSKDGRIIGSWTIDGTIKDIDGYILGSVSRAGRGTHPPPRTQTGVVNPRNICYQNVTWRLLLSSKKVLEVLFGPQSVLRPMIESGSADELSTLVWRMLENIQKGDFERSVQLLPKIWTAMQNIDPDGLWLTTIQQDAPEFFTKMLINSARDLGQTLKSVFAIEIGAQNICLCCGHQGEWKYQPANLVQVPLQPQTYPTANIDNKKISLKSPGNDLVDLLTTQFTDPEDITFKLPCEQCGDERWMHRQNDMRMIKDEADEQPGDRIVQLIRFNSALEKVDHDVQLTTRAFMLVNHPGLYRIECINIHLSGIDKSLGSGHYISFERGDASDEDSFDEWTRFEDDRKEGGWTLNNIQAHHSGDTYVLRLVPVSLEDVKALVLWSESWTQSGDRLLKWLSTNLKGLFNQTPTVEDFRDVRELLNGIPKAIIMHIVQAAGKIIRPSLPVVPSDRLTVLKPWIDAAMDALFPTIDRVDEYLWSAWQAVMRTPDLTDAQARVEVFLDNLRFDSESWAEVIMMGTQKALQIQLEVRRETASRIRGARSYQEIDKEYSARQAREEEEQARDRERRAQHDAERHARKLATAGQHAEEGTEEWQRAILASLAEQQGAHGSSDAPGQGAADTSTAPEQSDIHGETPASRIAKPSLPKKGQTPSAKRASRSSTKPSPQQTPQQAASSTAPASAVQATRTSKRQSGMARPNYREGVDNLDGTTDSPLDFGYDGTVDDMEQDLALAAPVLAYLEREDATPPGSPTTRPISGPSEMDLPIRTSPSAMRALSGAIGRSASSFGSSMRSLLHWGRATPMDISTEARTGTDSPSKSTKQSPDRGDTAEDQRMASPGVLPTPSPTRERQPGPSPSKSTKQPPDHGNTADDQRMASPDVLPTPSSTREQQPAPSTSKVKSMKRFFKRSMRSYGTRGVPYPYPSHEVSSPAPRKRIVSGGRVLSNVFRAPQPGASTATLIHTPRPTPAEAMDVEPQPRSKSRASVMSLFGLHKAQAAEDKELKPQATNEKTAHEKAQEDVEMVTEETPAQIAQQNAQEWQAAVDSLDDPEFVRALMREVWGRGQGGQ